MKPFKKKLIATIILIILYILLGNARSIRPNPFIEGANIAVNMIVPVIAGILFGRYTGMFTGLFGTAFNALTPAGTMFEILAIIPHSIMGYSAGWLGERFRTPISAGALIIGHVLNIIMFCMFNQIPVKTITNIFFWLGVGYETIVGIITIFVIVTIYRIAIKTNDINN